MPRAALIFLLLLSPGFPALAQDEPRRIVSMNLCTDQLVLLLVERERIAALSQLAADPAYSFFALEAAGIPGNRGQAEEVLAFAPDLILTSEFSATLAANLLERLGHPVVRLGFANSIEQVYAQMRQVAALTASAAVAEQLIATLQTELTTRSAALRPLLQGKSAVFYASNGYSYGANTLQHDFLASVGLRNIAAEAGLSGPALLPLETLLVAAPDYLLTDPRAALDSQLAHALLQHPALRALDGRTRVLEIPDHWFQCAGPQLAEAWRDLARQLADD